mmetsp:Transcript_31263/g.103930  ORF Transcript_31263/g.103930 Transcript_31263/m.103930 type:complete len:98 (+) Transcript_31263:166-459(+)
MLVTMTCCRGSVLGGGCCFVAFGMFGVLMWQLIGGAARQYIEYELEEPMDGVDLCDWQRWSTFDGGIYFATQSWQTYPSASGSSNRRNRRAIGSLAR